MKIHQLTESGNSFKVLLKISNIYIFKMNKRRVALKHHEGEKLITFSFLNFHFWVNYSLSTLCFTNNKPWNHYSQKRLAEQEEEGLQVWRLGEIKQVQVLLRRQLCKEKNTPKEQRKTDDIGDFVHLSQRKLPPSTTCGTTSEWWFNFTYRAWTTTHSWDLNPPIFIIPGVLLTPNRLVAWQCRRT